MAQYVLRVELLLMLKIRKRFSLLQQSQQTEAKIDHYLGHLTKSQLLFLQLWDEFFQYGARSKQTFMTIHSLKDNESEADNLRREIESLLFEKTLIPDARSDVMTLLEFLDRIINLHEGIAIHVKIEQPVIRKEFKPEMDELLKQVGLAIDHMVLCVRSFFADLERVKEYSTKTMHYESQADIACTALKMKIFDSDMLLQQKVQTRYFIDRIDELANLAEDTVDRITIYTIKRAL